MAGVAWRTTVHAGLCLVFLFGAIPPPARAEPCADQGELRDLRFQAAVIRRQLVILRDTSAALKGRTERIDPDASPTLWDLAEEMERIGQSAKRVNRLIQDRERELAEVERRLAAVPQGC